MVDKLVHKHLESCSPFPQVLSVGNSLVIVTKECAFKSLASNLISGEFLPNWPLTDCPLHTGSRFSGSAGRDKRSILKEWKSEARSRISPGPVIDCSKAWGRMRMGVTHKGPVSFSGENSSEAMKVCNSSKVAAPKQDLVDVTEPRSSWDLSVLTFLRAFLVRPWQQKWTEHHS